jgi:hypothetical protein
MEVSEYFDAPLYYRKGYTTLSNERAIELAVAKNYIESIRGNNHTSTEVGAVLPYYIENDIFFCIDPTDKKADSNEGVENYCFSNHNVLSISTFEHIGNGDYGMKKVPGLAYDSLKRVYDECHTCLISWPIGFNPELDNQVKNDENLPRFFFRRGLENGKLKWELTLDDTGFNARYGRPFQNGNSIIFITKGLL